MSGSLSAGLTGLNAHQLKLKAIGNNLANINTIGYKASQVEFADLVYQSVGGSSPNPMQVGLGVTAGAITSNFSQGGLDYTGIATHVAIQGNGFFVIGGDGGRSYTRAGNFGFDANGTLVTADGNPVQGFTAVDPATGQIDVNGQPTDIVVPPGVLRPPVATTSLGAVTNLDAAAAVGSVFTTSVPIYDSVGQMHVTTVTYTKVAEDAWDYSVSVPGGDVAGGVAGVPEVLANGQVTFDGAGALATVDGGAPADVVMASPVWANGAAAVNITWDLVNGQNEASVTSFASASATSSVTQNGSPAGAIDGLTIDASGQLLASFGAGQTVAVGQLAIANFNNPQGLVKQGNSALGESQASGSANIGTAGTGGRGSLVGSSLEQSNVDIAQEFTQMILAQRGYQANSKSITVADELMVETLNLKR